MVIQADEADFFKQLVQQPVIFQDGHPGIGPQQEVHPHGQHDQHHSRPLEGRTLPAHEIGHGVPDDQTDQRGDDGQLEGPQKHLGIAAHLHKIVQGEAAL